MGEIVLIVLAIIVGLYALVYWQAILVLLLIIAGIVLAVYVIKGGVSSFSESVTERRNSKLNEKRNRIYNQYLQKIAVLDEDINELTRVLEQYKFTHKVVRLLNSCESDSNNHIEISTNRNVLLSDGKSLQGINVPKLYSVLEDKKEQKNKLYNELSQIREMSEYRIDELYKECFNDEYRRNKRRLYTGVTAFMVVSIGTISYVYYIKPLLAYNTAQELFNNGQYSEAQSGFEKLGSYRDSQELAMVSSAEMKFSQAETLWNDGIKPQALTILSSVNERNGYDTATIERAKRKKLDYSYLLAIDYYDSGDYEEAKDLFLDLGTYKDSVTMFNKADQAIKYEAAIECFDKGQYSKAQKDFNALGNYKDSVAYEELSSSYIQLSDADTLYDEDWKESIKIYDQILKTYDELGDTLNSSSRADLLRYDLATKLITDGRYGTAKKYLEVLGEYSDSEVLLESVNNMMASYEQALLDYNDGNYEKVLTDLKGVGNYKKTKSLRKDSQNALDYLSALSLLEDNNNKEAFDSFSLIKDYKDSSKLMSIAEKGIALEHIESLFEDEKFDDAFSSISELSINDEDIAYLDTELNTIYQRGIVYMNSGDYESAVAIFSKIQSYSDSVDRANESQFQLLSAAITEEDYNSACAIRDELGEYRKDDIEELFKNSPSGKIYYSNLNNIQNHKYVLAYIELSQLTEYPDAVNYCNSLDSYIEEYVNKLSVSNKYVADANLFAEGASILNYYDEVFSDLGQGNDPNEQYLSEYMFGVYDSYEKEDLLNTLAGLIDNNYYKGVAAFNSIQNIEQYKLGDMIEEGRETFPEVYKRAIEVIDKINDSPDTIIYLEGLNGMGYDICEIGSPAFSWCLHLDMRYTTYTGDGFNGTYYFG